MINRAIVIGGGLAGAGVAVLLAEAGHSVLVLEREKGPHDKVCGEFLSCEAVDSLHRMGVDVETLGARPIHQVAVCKGRRRTVARLPFKAFSLSRRVLDEALLARARAAGAEVRRGERVTALERAASGWTVCTSKGETFAGDQAFLATGKHDLRGWKRPAGRQTDLIGFKTYVRLAPAPTRALDDLVELHLFPGGYAGLELVEGGRANLCLVIEKAVFTRLGCRWPLLLSHLARECPHLAARLQGGMQMQRPLAIAGIPYGYVCREASFWRLGDQAAVIPSFAGEGMAIALHSAELASHYALRGAPPADFQQHLAQRVGRQVLGATMLSKLLTRAAPQKVISAALARAPALAVAIARRTRIRCGAA